MVIIYGTYYIQIYVCYKNQQFDTIKKLPYHRTNQKKLGTVIDIMCNRSNKSQKSLFRDVPYMQYSMRVFLHLKYKKPKKTRV